MVFIIMQIVSITISSANTELNVARDSQSERVTPTSTTSSTPTSSPHIPSSSPRDKQDESTCPSQCIPINNSHRSVDVKTPLQDQNNNSIVNRLSSASSQTRAASAALCHNNRDPFAGFCRCRDLGPLRVCQRCMLRKTSPTI